MRDSNCPKAIIWGYGYTYNINVNLIKYQEIQNKIEVMGITGKNCHFGYIDGYKYIRPEELMEVDFDFIIICAGEYFDEICQEVHSLGISRKTIIDIDSFNIPMFDFAEYTRLFKTGISIIANNCWGGVVYHLLRMKFQSPFINMFEEDEDYIRLCENLRMYLDKKPEFAEMGYSDILEREYPIYKLGDVRLHFNHYTSNEVAEKKWNERVKRINWNNLFVMMYTEDRKIAEKFDKLNFDKKVCFVPFESNLESAYTLTNYPEDKSFWEIVNGIPGNKFIDYNVIDMLNGIKCNHDRLKTPR